MHAESSGGGSPGASQQDAGAPAEVAAENGIKNLPFNLVPGEVIKATEKLMQDGHVYLTNYRLVMFVSNTVFLVPLGAIDSVNLGPETTLIMNCKDAKSYSIKFESLEDSFRWNEKVISASTLSEKFEDSFAVKFHAATKKEQPEIHSILTSCPLTGLPYFDDCGKKSEYLFQREIERQKYDTKAVWRLTTINKDHSLCGTYPANIIVPSSISDENLKSGSQHRMSRRFPSVVYRHQCNGAVLMRSSQPTVGLWLWRNNHDEDFMKSVAEACAADTPNQEQKQSIAVQSKDDAAVAHDVSLADKSANESSNLSNVSILNAPTAEEMAAAAAAAASSDPTADIQSNYEITEANPQRNIKTVLMIDARSYTNAVANRARGGGFEYPEYYGMAPIQFMGLENIHAVRKMLQSVSTIVAELPDTATWLSSVDSSKWLYYISQLLRASVTVCRGIAVEGRPVLVHCSDGWDRTPQITALSQLMLDPYYRTFQGFEVLVEREWFDYGHKFLDRCGTRPAPVNERCPAFLQWLDALHQLMRQFPAAFEFNEAYLVKLAQHIYSNLFGNFLFNSAQERKAAEMLKHAYPVWSIFNFDSQRYINYFYSETHQVLQPSCHSKDLNLWTAVYQCPTLAAIDDLGNIKTQLSSQSLHIAPDMEEPELAGGDLTKTRSCEDLSQQSQPSMVRHASVGNLRDGAPGLDMLSVPFAGSTDSGSSQHENIEMAQLDSGVIVRASTTSHDDSSNGGTVPQPTLNPSEQSSSFSFPGDGGSEAVQRQEISKYEKCSNGRNSSKGSFHSAGFDGCSCLPAEQHGIAEAKKKNSEVASEISSGEIERAVEAEDGVTYDSEDEINFNGGSASHATDNSRMMRSDSDVSKALSTKTLMEQQELSGVRGSTDTLVNEDRVCCKCNSLLQSNNSHNKYSVCCHKEESLEKMCHKRELKRTSSDAPCDDCGVVSMMNCTVCTQSQKLLNGLNSRGGSGSAEGSKVASSKTTPGHSRTSSLGYVSHIDDEKVQYSRSHSIASTAAGGGVGPTITSAVVDGLVEVSDVTQKLVYHLLSKKDEEITALREQLATTQRALQQQLLHSSCSQRYGQLHEHDQVSATESVSSNSSCGAAYENGVLSDSSWEALEDGGLHEVTPGVTVMGRTPTLWVPDHYATQCHLCHTKFWVGLRKHHCRSCGGVFCYDCSGQAAAVPKEQLFNPVRVCRRCFDVLNAGATTSKVMSNGEGAGGSCAADHHNGKAAFIAQRDKCSNVAHSESHGTTASSYSIASSKVN